MYIISFQCCSQFLAGDAIRSKTRYRALDETAVFGSCCRHGCPRRFLSLKHGERFVAKQLFNMVYE